MSTVLPTGPAVASAVGPVVLPEVVSWQAALTPHATAVVSGDDRLDSAALDLRANQLAHHLVALGVGPESLVGVDLGRGVDLVVALLAVWRAGGAYVPLDRAHPADRRRWILADTGARVLLTHSDRIDSAPGPKYSTILLVPPFTVRSVQR